METKQSFWRQVVFRKADRYDNGLMFAAVVISIASMAVFGTHSVAALFATAAAFGLSYFTVACRSIAAVAAKGETP